MPQPQTGVDKGGSPTLKRLTRLLAYHEQMATAIRTTLALLQQDEHTDRKQRNGSVLAQALALDAARRTNGHGRKGGSAVDKSARREATAVFLQQFNTTKPHEPADARNKGIGTLVRHGYLKRKGKGYIRTGKDYIA